MKRVAIFRADLLPISETFIRDQMRMLRHWDPVLVGFRTVAGGLETPERRYRIVQRGNDVSFNFRVLMRRPLPRLVEALAESQADLVHVHFGTDATDIWCSVKAAGLPMLVTLHGYDINIRRDWWESGHGGLRRRLYPRRLLHMASDPTVHFLAVSRAVMRRAVEYGIPEQKIALSHIGVDTVRFQPGGLPLESRRKRILFVGRMVEKKAPLLMVRAFADVRRRIPDAELVMIGDGPLLLDAMQLAQALFVPVEFTGALGSEKVLEHVNQARVLCLPSVTAENGDAEGFGLTILEAQACGVPVVTSAVGGATEGLLQGTTGHAFQEGNMAQLVECLSTWLLDDDLAKAASVAARQFVDDSFNLPRCTQHLEGIYDGLATTEGPA